MYICIYKYASLLIYKHICILWYLISPRRCVFFLINNSIYSPRQTCIAIYIYICIYMHLCKYVYINMYIHSFKYTHIYTIFTNIYLHMYIYLYIYTYIHIYIYLCIHIYKSRDKIYLDKRLKLLNGIYPSKQPRLYPIYRNLINN
jgi:hypothetical protein